MQDNNDNPTNSSSITQSNIVKLKTILENLDILSKSLTDIKSSSSSAYTDLDQEINDLNLKLNKALTDITNLQSLLDTEEKVFKAVSAGEDVTQEDRDKMASEARNIAANYTLIRNSLKDTENKYNSVKNDVGRIKTYIDNSAKGDRPQDMSQEFKDLFDSFDHLVSSLKEETNTNLYKSISFYLSEGKKAELPSELTEAINNLVINKLEDNLKPYEEVSANYVSGKITHDQFTEALRKNALYSLLREKLIEDITRELENNNLSSSIIPTRMKNAVERMIQDAKNFNKVVTYDSHEAFINEIAAKPKVEGQTYIMSDEISHENATPKTKNSNMYSLD